MGGWCSVCALGFLTVPESACYKIPLLRLFLRQGLLFFANPAIGAFREKMGATNVAAEISLGKSFDCAVVFIGMRVLGHA